MSLQLYLGSQSPRRKELLASLGVQFEVLHANIDETPRSGEPAEQCVRRLAEAKAMAVWGSPARVEAAPVLASDTIVVLDQNILGKPRDKAHARAMLLQLSGREHRVMTAVALRDDRRQESFVQTSRVGFARLTAEEVARYVDTGEPDDKAGAYAIQGLAAAFITVLHGSYSGVVGLPLYETRQLLHRFGIKTAI